LQHKITQLNQQCRHQYVLLIGLRCRLQGFTSEPLGDGLLHSLYRELGAIEGESLATTGLVTVAADDSAWRAGETPPAFPL
jgi:hypothetical protein